jgi:hypothetical protein
MFDPAVFGIRISGRLRESWSEYFGAQLISIEEDETGCYTTYLVSEPVDQSALIGMINRLNGMGLPLVSVECMPAPGFHHVPSDNGPLRQDDA